MLINLNHVLCLGRCVLRYQLIGSWKCDGDSGGCMLPIDGIEPKRGIERRHTAADAHVPDAFNEKR